MIARVYQRGKRWYADYTNTTTLKRAQDLGEFFDKPYWGSAQWPADPGGCVDGRGTTEGLAARTGCVRKSF